MSAPSHYQRGYFRCTKCQRAASGKGLYSPEDCRKSRVLTCVYCGPALHEPVPPEARGQRKKASRPHVCGEGRKRS